MKNEMTKQERRREYRRVWTVIQRAQGNGFDIDLALAVHIYGRHLGLTYTEASEACYMAARAGLFGIIRKETTIAH